jgi:uncharacterized protein (TIGR02001 family)
MKNLTTPLSLAAALSLSLATTAAPVAFAQEAALTPDSEVSFNAALVSEYRYRGIAQSRLKPALQGGVDYVNNASGLYVGAWASTIKWIKDVGGDSEVEIDLYGGKRGAIDDTFSYDVGGLYYWYPSNDLSPSANTFELYGQVSAGPFYVKYSHSTSNLFGTANSKHSKYLDLGANIALGDGYVLNLHGGRQLVNDNHAYSYNDYKIGVSKDLGFATVSLAAIGADTDAYVSPRGNRNLGDTRAVLSLSKTF